MYLPTITWKANSNGLLVGEPFESGIVFDSNNMKLSYETYVRKVLVPSL